MTAVHGAYARYREPLIEGGVRLFGLKPYDDHSDVSLFGSSSASLHTNAFTVDDRTGSIGSMNFDPRSVSLNMRELMGRRRSRFAATIPAGGLAPQ